MKKIFLTLSLLLLFSLPGFCTESVFVPNITTEIAKKAIISYMTNNTNWLLKDDTNYSLNFYKIELVHDKELYKKEEIINKQLRKLRIEEAEKEGDYFTKELLEATNTSLFNDPDYYNSEKITNLQFVFLENNGVTITTKTSSDEIKEMIKRVFTGYYTYNIEYKIPLFKKNNISISDTTNTLYENYGRLGKNRKIVKINDKNISDLKKDDIRKILDNCTDEKLKLETNDNLGTDAFYIYRTFTEPLYKQYIQL